MTRSDYWRRRCLIAEMNVKFEKRNAEHTERWAVLAFDEQRRLSERCTYLYGLAARFGATNLELSGPS